MTVIIVDSLDTGSLIPHFLSWRRRTKVHPLKIRRRKVGGELHLLLNHRERSSRMYASTTGVGSANGELRPMVQPIIMLDSWRTEKIKIRMITQMQHLLWMAEFGSVLFLSLALSTLEICSLRCSGFAFVLLSLFIHWKWWSMSFKYWYLSSWFSRETFLCWASALWYAGYFISVLNGMLGLPKRIRNILTKNFTHTINMCSENIVIIAGAPVEVEFFVLVDNFLLDSVVKGGMHPEAKHQQF